IFYKVQTPLPRPAEPIESPPRQRLAEELLRHERAGARAEARPRMGARADVVEPVDRGRVPRQLGARTPNEVLVERTGAAVDVAAHEVHVGRLEIGGREHDPLQEGRVEVLDLAREASLDAVGVALPQLLRPDAVAHVELAGRIALHARGQLLELDPEDRRAGRSPRSASLTARETPSSPGVTWTIAVRPRRSSPVQRGGSESAMWICISARPYLNRRAAAVASLGTGAPARRRS